jgi:predicted ferric reductase
VEAISAFGILGFVSLQFVTRIFYDFLLDLHLLFSGVAFIAGWRHVSKAPLARLAIQLAVTFWASISLLHWGYFVFRNVVVGRSFASVIATPVSDLTVVDGPRLDTTTVLQVDVAVPRPWSVRAGQHIFLSIPSLGILTGLRGHPFTIVSWHRGRQGLNISLLIEVRSGFTRALCQQAHKPLRAFIDGPFGGTHELGEFGTVIMVATGIGIAGHLMYLEKLVQGYRKLEVKTRRIVLIWQIQRECEQQRPVSRGNADNS